MRKILLFIFFIILNGCSFTNLFVGGEIDKVTVVKYAPYMKHHRAYFARSNLKKLRNGKKYLYLYNAKTNDVAVLLHRKNQYVLYNMSNPEIKALAINVDAKQKYQQALRTFKHRGYKRIKSLASVGHTVSASYKRYKGVKTLLIETKEYSKLQSLYQDAIQNHNAKKVLRIKTKLPKGLISAHYSKHVKYAKTRKQLLALKKIANKLGLHAPHIPKQKNKNPSPPKKKSKPIKKTPIVKKVESPKKQEKLKEKPLQKEILRVPSVHRIADKPYRYYLKHATLRELSIYNNKQSIKHTISHNQYSKLKHREAKLKEEELVKYGSLEELISAYKINKKEKYKRRIMSLMKSKQTQH